MQSTNDIPQNEIEFKVIKPVPALADFVESFWMLSNHSETEKEIVVLPDGKFDIIFSHSDKAPYQVSLIGLSSQAEQIIFPSKRIMFTLSFKLLAIEYLLDIKAVCRAVLQSTLTEEGFYWQNTYSCRQSALTFSCPNRRILLYKKNRLLGFGGYTHRINPCGE